MLGQLRNNAPYINENKQFKTLAKNVDDAETAEIKRKRSALNGTILAGLRAISIDSIDDIK